MKFSNYAMVLILGIGSACSNGPAPENEPGTVTGPAEWITCSGKDGPGTGKHIVLVSGDEEYRSEEALPQLARILAERHGFDCTVLFAQDPGHKGLIDPNYRKNIPGVEALHEADLLVLFTRFRALPDDQMQHLERYLLAGKPVLAIRTATHAFEFEDSTSRWNHWSNSFQEEDHPWNGGFGRLVLGEKWHTHHGHHKHQSTRGVIAPGAAGHPVTNGLENGSIWGPTDVYGVRLPLPDDAMPLILGQVINRAGAFDENDPFFGMKPSDNEIAAHNPGSNADYNPNDPMMPIAWTKTYQLPDGAPGKAFTSTIGASVDLANEGVRRLLVNAAYYLLDLKVPEKADVRLVGNYQPSAFSFHTDEYWAEKNLRVEDYVIKKD
jgi:hypothetical protein